MMVELDMPNRTTRDYDLPQVAPRIQAALDAALQDEEDIDIEGGYVILENILIRLRKIKALFTIY